MCLPKRIGKQVNRAVDRIADTLLAFPFQMLAALLSYTPQLVSLYQVTDFKWEKTFCLYCVLSLFFLSSTTTVLSPPANSSDSEDQSVAEGTAKTTASKNNASDVKAATSPKCHGRSPPSSHKYHKQGDADHTQHRDNHGRSPRVYKWSFQMCKCRTLNCCCDKFFIVTDIKMSKYF